MNVSSFTDYVSDRDFANVPQHNRDLSGVPRRERYFTRFKQGVENFPPKLVSRARRAAARRGWRVEKGRGSGLHEHNRGGLRIVDENGIVVDGFNFDLTAQEALELCASLSPSPEIKIDLRFTTERGVYGFVYVGETRVGFAPPECVVRPESIVLFPVKGWPLMPRPDREAAADALRQRFPNHVVSL